MKNDKHIAGLYMRLSQEDERTGESLSIENQRQMLRRYAEENDFEIYDEYIDDGISGTTFNRPEVQRLLDNAKTGTINTIIVKDLSRFGRNYIEVGQYIDYVFPAFGIRFIAIQDNVDTANRDSGAMEMMPIMNVFNEWHAANTSKKIRAVKKANAQQGIYTAKKAAYGYIMGTDEKRAPIIDEDVAPIVVRIFEMYAWGMGVRKIAEVLTQEKILPPAIYAQEKYGWKGRPNALNIWSVTTVREMLHNPIYIGHMPQLRWTSLSYKNHRRFRKDPSEWTVIYNTHKPIISKELWDKVRAREKSVSHGRVTKNDYIHPLSGFVYCADCGQKMKLSTHSTKKGTLSYNFNCGYYVRYGKSVCFSHYMSAQELQYLVRKDIREIARYVALDEQSARDEFIRHNAELTGNTIKSARKELTLKQKRLEELSRLMQSAYEDKVKGTIPEDICVGFIEKYSAEQKTLKEEIATISERISQTECATQNVDEFIRNIKKYIEAPELTREMCYELIERIIVGAPPKDSRQDRIIEIVYKIDIASVLRHKLPQ